MDNTILFSSDKLRCYRCDDGYILRDGETSCVSILEIPFCHHAAETGSDCVICQKGHGLVKSKCIKGELLNCAEYNTSDNLNSIICEKCHPGFYLDDKDECHPGDVIHCEEYNDSPNSCKTCRNGFLLVESSKLKGSHNYCYPVDQNINCKEGVFESNSLGGKFNCEECLKPNAVLRSPADDKPATNCLPHNKIENCNFYEIGDSLLESTFLCNKCMQGYFYDKEGAVCVSRKDMIKDCETYYEDEHKCKKCSPGFFLKDDDKFCMPFPIGVIGCRIYEDLETCTACDQNRYITEEGECSLVLEDSQITNCMYYSDEKTCEACESGFLLTDLECKAVNVSNCDEFQSVDECSRCKYGYHLNNEGEISTCTLIVNTSCELLEANGENKCVLCQKNHYITEEGKCQLVTNIIANC